MNIFSGSCHVASKKKVVDWKPLVAKHVRKSRADIRYLGLSGAFGGYFLLVAKFSKAIPTTIWWLDKRHKNCMSGKSWTTKFAVLSFEGSFHKYIAQFRLARLP